MYTIKYELVSGNIGNTHSIVAEDLATAQLIWETLRFCRKEYIVRSVRPGL